MRTFAVLAGAPLVAACLAVSVPALTPTKVVKIGDFFYSPKRLTVRKGTRVAWPWAGYLLHNGAGGR